jgi:hypothetical protein
MAGMFHTKFDVVFFFNWTPTTLSNSLDFVLPESCSRRRTVQGNGR